MKNFKFNNNIKIFTLREDSIIEDAIVCLNKSSSKIVLIIDKELKFLGTISDGDIRRGLINGCHIIDQIKLIMHRSPVFVIENKYNENDLENIVKNYGLLQIPLVSKKNILLGLYEFGISNEINFVETPIFIMAGGRGIRLMPYTENTPKPLLEVNGKPIIEHIILNAKNQNFNNFFISVNYLSDKIKDYLGNGDRFGVKISYIEEDTPLGTIGTNKKVQSKISSTFIVTNGDLLSDIEYKSLLKFHKSENVMASMAVRSIKIKNKFGVVKLDGLKISGFEEKPIEKININAGIYVFEPAVINLISANEKIDTPELFDRIRKKNGDIIAYPIYERWQDIGTPEDLMKTYDN